MAGLVAAALLALASLALCVRMARRDDVRFAQFERVPAKFSLPGHPAELLPRKLVVYLTPTLFAAILVLIFGTILLSPSDPADFGGLIAGLLIMTLLFPAIGRLFTVIIERWAQDQT